MGMRDYLKERPLLYFMAKNLGTAGLIVIGSLWTYTHHPSVQRLEDSLFRRNVPVREGYFPDPSGISILIEVSEDGYKAGYLTHDESSYRHPLGEDLLPDTGYILECLEKRARKMEKKEVKQTLEKLLEVERSLYGRL
jgi:hypothetical protein